MRQVDLAIRMRWFEDTARSIDEFIDVSVRMNIAQPSSLYLSRIESKPNGFEGMVMCYQGFPV